MRVPKDLEKIYRKFDNCRRCKQENNPCLHVLGGGKFKNPRFLFLFINPTHLNISSHKDYKGNRRYPFIGVRYFYRLLSKAGFVRKDVVEDIYENGWQIEHEYKIEDSLVANGVYLTNLIKCTQLHPKSPAKDIIQEDLPLLKEEINIVSPKYIVTFGKLPFKFMTNQEIRLKDCLDGLRKSRYKSFKSINILGKTYEVLPCYFPVGRGNPKAALEILRYIKRNIK